MSVINISIQTGKYNGYFFLDPSNHEKDFYLEKYLFGIDVLFILLIYIHTVCFTYSLSTIIYENIGSFELLLIFFLVAVNY